MRIIQILLLLFLWTSTAYAGIRPSFHFEECTWKATHIVVATEGAVIDGVLTVIESWHGDLEPGESITVPELAAFDSEESRIIDRKWHSEETVGNHPTEVTGFRMALFLVKKEQPETGKEGWASATFWEKMFVSVVWIESDQVYGFVQENNPGPSILIPLRLTENDMKCRVLEIVRIRANYQEAVSLPDPAKRAEALGPIVFSDVWRAKSAAFDALEECGKDALPVLRTMLEDDSIADRHGRVIEAFAKAGGETVGKELTDMLTEEFQFWTDIAPGLQKGWWNGVGLEWKDVGTLRNRYNVALEILHALKGIGFKGCESLVVNFRDFWRSLPQLEDRSGLDQMSQTCDAILGERYRKPQQDSEKKDEVENASDDEQHDSEATEDTTTPDTAVKKSSRKHHAGVEKSVVESDLEKASQPVSEKKEQSSWTRYLRLLLVPLCVLLLLIVIWRKHGL